MPRLALKQFHCTKCGAEGEDNFYSYRPTRCKLCLKNQGKEYVEINYQKERARQRDWALRNKDRARQYCKNYYESNKEQQRKRSLDNYYNNPSVTLLRKYGITFSDYCELYDTQKGKCLICFKECPIEGSGKLVVDHCHDTGKIRGLLCRACNRGIGMLKDNPDLILNAHNYLLNTGKGD